MSMNLIELAKSFLNEGLSAQAFSDTYIASWRRERNANILKDDAPGVSECASTIFILADCFNPDADRTEGEVDENGLKIEIREVLNKFNLL
ncbi:colicin immunity domain-containing protein [Pseudomonas huaxiensis]|uniref:colicin immunity domain-containing protein n=1 Tax=Pseudomonas huaxiensis TaxID=2213017 RepID=UPI000DA6CA9F|nr:colicin immunity domain-containing protein [Pseudomonas huaxiensis]